MTRIYEALEQFDLEQSGVPKRSLSVPQVSKKDDVVSPALTETLIGLYRTIFTVVPGSGGRVIQFVESGKGDGCSKIIRAFAKVSSSVLKKSVLLLDSDPQLPSNFDFFNHQSRLNWINKLENDRGDNASKSLRDKNLLSVCRLSMEPRLLPVDTDSTQTEEFMDKLKQTFDLTLVDSWSVAVPPKPRLFSPHVDGIVLVINAGKTRWQIAEKQKRELAAQGGNVLGVILNNRTYPIPDSIYSRL
jgi:Mrp family chromosome partitioning ATPase